MVPFKLSASPNANGDFEMGRWPGGEGDFTCFGTFSGGTAKLQYSPDDKTTWIDVGSSTNLTANGHGSFKLPIGVFLRVNLAGATMPTLTAKVEHITGVE